MEYPLSVSTPSVPVIGWLELRGLRCRGRHGSSPGEQETERELVVDVRVQTDLGPAVAADALDAALDIAALAETVRAAVAGPPRVLLERVAWDSAQAVLRRFGAVTEVQVRLAKPEPAGLGAAEEAVEVRLRR